MKHNEILEQTLYVIMFTISITLLIMLNRKLQGQFDCVKAKITDDAALYEAFIGGE